MLKQCRSYVKLSWVVVIFIFIMSNPVVAFIDIFGLSLMFPEMPSVWVH